MNAREKHNTPWTKPTSTPRNTKKKTPNGFSARPSQRPSTAQGGPSWKCKHCGKHFAIGHKYGIQPSGNCFDCEETFAVEMRLTPHQKFADSAAFDAADTINSATSQTSHNIRASILQMHLARISCLVLDDKAEADKYEKVELALYNAARLLDEINPCPF
jgi:hypothetical protein